MKKYFWTLSIIYLISNSVAHAQKVKGKVVSPSNEGIPFVHIQVVGTTKGTITNEKGEFNLILTEMPCQIRVGSVGYQTVTENVKITSQPILIKLSEGVSLHEVIVMPDSLLKSILSRAYRKITENYPNKLFALEGFYRELHMSKEQIMLYYGEAYLTVILNGYQAKNEDAQVEVLKARINKNPVSDSIDNTKWYGGPFIANWSDPVKSRVSFINPNSFNKKYRYTLSEIIPSDYDSLYVISFVSNDKQEQKSGKIWINKKTLAYVKIVYQNNNPPQLNPLTPVKKIHQEYEISYTLQNGLWHIAHASLKGKYFNKHTQKETTHDLAFVTTRFEEEAAPIPYEKRLLYGAIFSEIKDNHDPAFWDNYTTLEADSSLKRQMGLFREVSNKYQENLFDQTHRSKTLKGKLQFVRHRLSFGYGIGLAQYAKQSPITATSYQSKPIDNEKIFPSGNSILLLRSTLGFQLTNRWKLDISYMQEILRKDYHKITQFGITYNQLLKKRGNPIFAYAVAGVGCLREGYLLPEFKNNANLISQDNRFDGSVDIFYVNKEWVGISGLGFAFKKKRREYFLESNCRFFINNTSPAILIKSQKLFGKKTTIPPEQAGFQIILSDQKQVTQSLNFTVGIKWHL